jgi:hypothetical protein
MIRAGTPYFLTNSSSVEDDSTYNVTVSNDSANGNNDDVYYLTEGKVNYYRGINEDAIATSEQSNCCCEHYVSDDW